MTLIEFYDRAPIENIISSIAVKPAKVVFIGGEKRMIKQGEQLEKFCRLKSYNIEFSYVKVNKYDLWGIVDRLCDIIESEDECAFDLNGGDDLSLVAMGIVYQMYAQKGRHIQMHRYNINSGIVSDCDRDGKVLPIPHQCISVDDNILLHGGAIRYQNKELGKDGTVKWNIDSEFKNDVRAMWDICKRNPSKWNLLAGRLSELEHRSGNVDEICSISVEQSPNMKENIVAKVESVVPLLYRLSQSGLIRNLRSGRREIAYEYRNELIHNCIKKAGTVLELMVLVLASEAVDKEGKPKYNDAMSGVCIDWDGEFGGGDYGIDVENEIDVFLMRGLVPILISCKNGMADIDELYKLSTVANRFGGPYAKKVLVATHINKSIKSQTAFRLRAEEMNIELISNVHKLTDEEFASKIKNLK